MKQFIIPRGNRYGHALKLIADQLSIKWQLVDRDFEKSWDLYATKILDELSRWCKNSGIKNFGVGHTQIAIQLTFLENKDAVMFKLRWHYA